MYTAYSVQATQLICKTKSTPHGFVKHFNCYCILTISVYILSGMRNELCTSVVALDYIIENRYIWRSMQMMISIDTFVINSTWNE